MVTVKGYVDRVVIVAGGQVDRDARSGRSADGTMVLDPIHYLATLGRKPGALDHAPVLPRLEAPGLLRRVPRRAGSTPRCRGRRAAVRAGPATAGRHPLDRVRRAVEACQREQLDQCRSRHPADAHASAAIESRPAPLHSRTPGSRRTALRVQVPLPDLSRFNQLLGGSAGRRTRGGRPSVPTPSPRKAKSCVFT